MKNTEIIAKKKPLFTGISSACVLLALILLFSVSGRMNEGEAVQGYSGLGISVSFTVALLLSGIILGQIALFRGEKPALLAFFVLLLNIAGTIHVLYSLGSSS